MLYTYIIFSKFPEHEGGRSFIALVLTHTSYISIPKPRKSKRISEAPDAKRSCRAAEVFLEFRVLYTLGLSSVGWGR